MLDDFEDGRGGVDHPMGRQLAPGSLVPWAVLGLVIEKPSYGYELARRLERRFDGLLAVSASNVYTTLDRLVKHGMVEEIDPDLPTSRRRQRRLHYRATADGARAYRRWLALRLHGDELRRELLVRLASISMRGPVALEELLGLYEAACIVDGEGMERAGSGARDAELMPGLMRRLFELERRMMLATQLEWVAHAREELRRFAALRSSSAPPRPAPGSGGAAPDG